MLMLACKQWNTLITFNESFKVVVSNPLLDDNLKFKQVIAIYFHINIKSHPLNLHNRYLYTLILWLFGSLDIITWYLVFSHQKAQSCFVYFSNFFSTCLPFENYNSLPDSSAFFVILHLLNHFANSILTLLFSPIYTHCFSKFSPF